MKYLPAIEAISDGLIDGGGEVFTNFPGFISHQLFSKLGGKITSVNEKIAYEIAWGASFAGKRSVVTFKNVGLNDAADPFLNSMLVGTNAGLVIVVFDDVYVEASQSRQDSRHYFNFFGGLWYEPYSVQNAYDCAYQAFEISEIIQLPIVIRITNQLIYQKGKHTRSIKQNKILSIPNNHKQFVIHPINSAFQRKELLRKNKKIQKFIDELYTPYLNKLVKTQDKLLLSFGPNKAEEKRYLNQGFKKIQLFTYPFPKLINDRMKMAKKIVILEQGDKFAYEKVFMQDSRSVDIESNTGIIPDKSSGYIISNNYRKLFLAVKKVRPSFVVGDLGEYTQDTLSTINACLCFGSSISVGIGAILGGAKSTLSIIGDGAYLHSGKNAIPEAIKRNCPVKLIVICNGGSQGTGGQEIPGDLFYQPQEVEKHALIYNTAKTIDFERILRKMLMSSRVSVLYILM